MGKSTVLNLFNDIKEKVVEKNRYFPIRVRVLNKYIKKTLRKIDSVEVNGIKIVLGELIGTGKIGVQSIIFDTFIWTKSDAKRWYKNNKDVIKFLLSVDLIKETIDEHFKRLEE